MTLRASLALIIAACAAMLILPGVALARTKTVAYRGLRLSVPQGWPVFHLGRNSRVCVRFNRHAVYLGQPGADELCPLAPIGRTEAILVAPAPAAAAGALAGRGVLTPVSTAGAALNGGSMARLLDRSRRLLVTVTWNRHRDTILRALHLRSLRPALRATNGHRPKPVRLRNLAAERPHLTSASTPATPGEVFNGLGFDTCMAPSTTALSAWATTSPFAAVGIYIGGADMACAQANLNPAWVSAESAAGWHLIPTYVGLQAPVNSCNCAAFSATPAVAATQGTAAAQDAVAQAQALGIGTGNPIYFDMEAYTPSPTTTAAVLAFLAAWTQQLHTSGYLAGVYSSGASGINDLVSQVGTPYLEPDDLWIADWNNQQTVSDPYVPPTVWANSQRLHQYLGAQTENYGGVAINLDSDYLDGPTAAAGSAAPPPPPIPPAPSLTVTAHADGSVALSPQWQGEPGILQYQILGGSSPTAMNVVATAPATQTAPVVVRAIYPYFEVQALGAGGQVLGTSAPASAQSLVALFDANAFVSPRGKLGVPVACMNGTPCKVQASIYRGSGRFASAAPESVSRHGGIVHIAVGPQLRRALLNAANHELPVRLSLVNGTGVKTKATVNLIAYNATGQPPRTSPGASADLQILATTGFVSNGWVGEIPVVCTANVSCKTAMRVTTRSGQLIALGRTPTLGAGEIAELHFQMTRRGNTLLRAGKGNQLAARVIVKTSLVQQASSGATPVGIEVAKALVTLTSY